MLFDSWFAMLRILAVGVPCYFLLVAGLRVTGKRALAKMNAFDLVITVSLGSTLATTFLSKDVKLAEGVLAFVMLLALQRMMTSAAKRWPWVQELVLAQPTLLLHKGKPLSAALKQERITKSELLSAVRAHGHMSLQDVEAVVLEPDGTFSVMARQNERDSSAMATVWNFSSR